MKTSAHLWQYLAEFFLEWEVFQTKAPQKIKIHNLCSVTPPPLPPTVKLDKVPKYGTTGQATDVNITWPMRFARWITEATNAY